MKTKSTPMYTIDELQLKKIKFQEFKFIEAVTRRRHLHCTNGCDGRQCETSFNGVLKV